MKRSRLPGLSLLFLISALSGCHHPMATPRTANENTVGYVSLKNGTFDIQQLVYKGQQLVWKGYDDSKTPEFWIRFEDKGFCTEEKPGDLHWKANHPATCTVQKKDDQPYSYSIYDHDPDVTPAPSNARQPVKRFVQNCRGCT